MTFKMCLHKTIRDIFGQRKYGKFYLDGLLHMKGEQLNHDFISWW